MKFWRLVGVTVNSALNSIDWIGHRDSINQLNARNASAQCALSFGEKQMWRGLVTQDVLYNSIVLVISFAYCIT